MKKASFFLLVMILTASFVSANGNKDVQGRGGNIKLQFMGWEASVYETESNKAALADYMAGAPGVEVEYIAGPFADHHTKLLTMMAGGAAPDTFYVDISYYRDFVKSGQLLDITDLYNDQFANDAFVEWSLEKSRINGKYYGIDSCIVSNILFYNKDLFDRAHVPYPPSDPEKSWTWEQFLDAAKKLTIREGNTVKQYGVYGFDTDFQIVEAYLVNEGITFGNVALEYTSPEYKVNDPAKMKQIMQRIKDLRTVHNVAAEAATSSTGAGMSPNQMLQTGRVAMVAQGSYSMQELATMGFRFGVAPLPRMSSKASNGLLGSYNVGGWKGTKYPAETMALMASIASTKFQLPFIKSGLWMGNRVAFYEPGNINNWFNPAVHPEELKGMISIFKNARILPTFLLGSNARDVSTEEIQNFYFNNQDAQITIDNMIRRINEGLKRL
jgi:multiple sugar transport system substrate-binding protein